MLQVTNTHNAESVASEDTIDVTFIRDHMATLFQSLETVLKPGDVAQAMPLFLRSKQLAHNVFVRRDPSKGALYAAVCTALRSVCVVLRPYTFVKVLWHKRPLSSIYNLCAMS